MVVALARKRTTVVLAAALAAACGTSGRTDQRDSGAGGAGIGGIGIGGIGPAGASGSAGAALSSHGGMSALAGASAGGATGDAGRGGAGAAMSLAPGVVLAAGHYHTCAVRSGGRVYCWGTRSQVQVCDPNCITEPPHEIEGLTGVTEITAGIVHACALRGDGTLRCWGGNKNGEVGPFEKVDDLPPQLLELGQPVRHVGSGVSFTCAVLLDGSTVCWGNTPTFAQRGGGSVDPELVENLGPVAFLSGALEHACAILESGEVECWGVPRFAQLGMGEPVTSDPNSPVRVTGLTGVLFLDSQPSRNCILFGVSDPVCWGLNIERPPTVESGNVEQPIPMPLSLGAPMTRVSLGSFHACGVRNDGHVVCWGANNAGELGVGDTEEHAGAVEVLGLTDAVEIAAGANHTCVLRSDQSVWCWGSNAYRQLGTSSTDLVQLPSPVGLPD